MASESKSRRADKAKAGAAARKPAGRGKPASRGLLNMDSEQSARALLVGGVTLIVAIALGFIMFGYWYSVVRPRNRTVLEVDGVKVSYNAMKRRMTYELFQNVALQQQPRALPELTFQTLLEELTLVSRAESDLGVVATPDELDKKLRSKVGAGVEADQKQFADALLRQLNISGLHDEEYRRMTKAELLTSKIKDKFKLEAPLTVTQAKIEVIAVNRKTPTRPQPASRQARTGPRSRRTCRRKSTCRRPAACTTTRRRAPSTPRTTATSSTLRLRSASSARPSRPRVAVSSS